MNLKLKYQENIFMITSIRIQYGFSSLLYIRYLLKIKDDLNKYRRLEKVYWYFSLNWCLNNAHAKSTWCLTTHMGRFCRALDKHAPKHCLDVNLEKIVFKLFLTVGICFNCLEILSEHRKDNKIKITNLFVFNYEYKYVLLRLQLKMDNV